MASYLMPKRGSKAKAIADNILLRSGEIFFELPEAGIGKGAGKIKMGNGLTTYADLPYFTADINEEVINFTDTSVATDKSLNDTYLANIKPSNPLKTIFTNLKQLLFNYNKQLNDLSADIDEIDINISNKADLVDGNVPIDELGNVTKNLIGLDNVANYNQTKAINKVVSRGRSGNRLYFRTTALDGTYTDFYTDTEAYDAGTGLEAGTTTPGVTDFSVKYGTEAGTACQGNDSRLSDSRNPVAHASETTNYGGGTSSNYGHVKLSNTYKSLIGSSTDSLGGSQSAVYNAYHELSNTITREIHNASFSVYLDVYPVYEYCSLNGELSKCSVSVKNWVNLFITLKSKKKIPADTIIATIDIHKGKYYNIISDGNAIMCDMYFKDGYHDNIDVTYCGPGLMTYNTSTQKIEIKCVKEIPYLGNGTDIQIKALFPHNLDLKI